MLLQNTLAMPGYILIAKSFLSKITQKKQSCRIEEEKQQQQNENKCIILILCQLVSGF